jgi:2-polyprenyl-3-methyl-5-hydroxy-6-metoxy-1,4-benzoquinol methylase
MAISVDVQLDVEALAACPLCEGSSWTKLAVPDVWMGTDVLGDLRGQLGLVRCSRCSLTFTNPRPSPARLGSFYAGDTYVCHELGATAAGGATGAFVLNQMAKYLPADAPRTLLDYGTGGGGLMSYAAKQGWQTRGFEPGRRGLQTCRAAGLDVTDDLRALPRGTFGLVTLLYVFEHLANPKEALRAIRPLLARNGRLFVGVPNVGSLRARLAHPVLSRWLPVQQRYLAYPLHLIYYSRATLCRMLAEAGWTVEATFTMGVGLNEYLARPNARRNGNRAVGANSNRNGNGNGAYGHPRSVRRRIRDAFLALGLGENVAAVAYPAR